MSLEAVFLASSSTSHRVIALKPCRFLLHSFRKWLFLCFLQVLFNFLDQLYSSYFYTRLLQLSFFYFRKHQVITSQNPLMSVPPTEEPRWLHFLASCWILHESNVKSSELHYLCTVQTYTSMQAQGVQLRASVHNARSHFVSEKKTLTCDIPVTFLYKHYITFFYSTYLLSNSFRIIFGNSFK